MSKYVKIEDVMNLINTSNRGTCDYFIIDQIEELCTSEKVIEEKKIRAKTIDEIAERLKEENNYWDISNRVIDEIAEQMKAGAENENRN